jgi:prepilin-type N-terminal cleavage/methylation domain-containing protein
MLTNNNEKGFSLVEVMVSIGLLAVIGVGMVALNSQQKTTQAGIKSAGDMVKVMNDLRTLIGDPKACEINFLGQDIGESGLKALKDSSGTEILRVGDKLANNTYQLSGIDLSDYNTSKLRAKVKFQFTGITDNVRSKSVSRSFYVFSREAGGKISECLDPVKLTSDGALKKSCLDVDPLKEGDCEKIYANLLTEVKKLYCENHPYLEYNPVSMKCLPLDAGHVCPAGKVMRGYSATGKTLDCVNVPSPTYPPEDTAVVPGPPKAPTTCSSWSPYTPSDTSVCYGTNFMQTSTCLDAGSALTDPRSATGKMTTGSCCDDWGPAPDGTCSDKKVTQTNKCGETRIVDGTKSCAVGCLYKHPVIWDSGSYPIVQCVEWYLPVGGQMTEETVAEGDTIYMTSGYCPQGSACHGSIRMKCENGVMKEVSKSCMKGFEP